MDKLASYERLIFNEFKKIFSGNFKKLFPNGCRLQIFAENFSNDFILFLDALMYKKKSFWKLKKSLKWHKFTTKALKKFSEKTYLEKLHVYLLKKYFWKNIETPLKISLSKFQKCTLLLRYSSFSSSFANTVWPN